MGGEVDDEMVLDTTVQPFEWTLDPADYEGQRVVTVVADVPGTASEVEALARLLGGTLRIS